MTEATTVYYLGYYNDPDRPEKSRMMYPSSASKMQYVIHVLESNGYYVHVLSACRNIDGKISRTTTSRIGKNSSLTFFASIGRGAKFRNILSRFFTMFYFYRFLFFNCKNAATLILYHSMLYSPLIIEAAKFIKRFRIIYEVEELYTEVTGGSRKREFRYFAQADAFIFPTILLNKAVNPHQLEYVILHGSYCLPDEKHNLSADSKIHCVYAGTFSEFKGVMTAIDSAKYLDNRYHVHIIGYGEPVEIENVINRIQQISNSTTCIVSYDGLLLGAAYNQFLHNCDIGLCTQPPNLKLNETSFPSKILTYLSNGLRVVTIRMRSLETSDVAFLLTFYSNDSAQEVAFAIKSVDLFAKYDSRNALEQMHIRFQKELRHLLNSVSRN